MNNLDKQYTDLLQDILDNGVTKSDRTGTGTISIFGRQIRHKMSDGFPLLTTKKMPFKTIVTELLWFLRGDTNIKFLVDNNCHIWDGDTYKNYLNNWKPIGEGPIYINPLSQEEFINRIKTDVEFAKKWGNLGSIYGKQWRRWNKVNFDNIIVDYSGDNTGYTLHEPIDQIQNLINELKTNPDSRRLMVNAWNVGELDQMVLPPCHYGFQVYTRELSLEEREKIALTIHNVASEIEKRGPMTPLGLDRNGIPTRTISLMWNQRSVDTFLGLPFNIASYGLLLHIIAKAVNMVPDELIGNLGDVHLYSNHIEQAKEQIGRELSHSEKVEYARSLYGEEEWWNINDKRVIKILHSNKRTRQPFPLPTLKHLRSDDKYTLLNEFPSLWSEFKISDFEIENYQSHPTIKAPLSN